MSDGFQTGRKERQQWEAGENWLFEVLGPFDAAMPISDVHRRMEHDKLLPSFKDDYERGWLSVQPQSRSGSPE